MRRASAWVFDCLPLAAYALYATPSLLTLWLLRAEAAEGVGIFDPSTGRDPVALRRPPDLRFVLFGAILWVAVELVSRAVRRRSLGESLFAAAPRSRRRGFVVDTIRYGLPLAWIGAAALFAPR